MARRCRDTGRWRHRPALCIEPGGYEDGGEAQIAKIVARAGAKCARLKPFSRHLAFRQSNVAASERVAKLTPWAAAYRQRRKVDRPSTRAWDVALARGLCAVLN